MTLLQFFVAGDDRRDDRRRIARERIISGRYPIERLRYEITYLRMFDIPNGRDKQVRRGVCAVEVRAKVVCRERFDGLGSSQDGVVPADVSARSVR